jgi:DNA replication protein DnaC
MEAAKIPASFEGAELDNFGVDHFSCSESQKAAHFMAKKFAEKSIAETASKGMMFTGQCGTGKTHLAIGILKKLIRTQRRRGLFYSSYHLLELIKSSFDREDLSEWEIMRPVLDRDILLLDDLGAGKITEFVQEKLAYILMERYNRKLTTLITTNYPVAPPRDASADNRVGGKTLGDCIGERSYSRLLEMCVVIPVNGPDFRDTVKRARSEML